VILTLVGLGVAAGPVAAVREASTGAMMLVGFAGIGYRVCFGVEK
jgi:hypothetical protein